MFRSERIFILSALLVVGLSLTLALGAAQSVAPFWLILVALTLLAGAGTRWLKAGTSSSELSDLANVRLPLVRVPVDMVLPCLMVVGFSIFLQFFGSGAVQAAIVALAGLALGAVFWAQVHALDTRDRYFGLAQTVLNVGAHLAVFLLFSVVYGLKLRSIWSASAVGLVTALVVYELLARDAAWHTAMGLPVEGRRTTLALLATAAGVVAAEITWGLNYWAALTMLVGGAFLLLVFYVVQGLASHYVDHKLTRGTILEFGGVGTLGVLVVFASAFFG